MVDQNSKKNSGLGTDDYEVLKPLDLDKPFNFTFPGYKDLNSFDPLLEAQEGVFRLSESSLGGLGFVSPVKDSKEKGYFLRSSSQKVVTGVLDKTQSGVVIGDNLRDSVCSHEKDLDFKLDHLSGTLRAVEALSRVSL